MTRFSRTFHNYPDFCNISQKRAAVFGDFAAAQTASTMRVLS
jgi:hypothetical protein